MELTINQELQSAVDSKASEVRQYLTDAAGDMGFECGDPKSFHWQEPDIQKKILEAKKNGVTDIQGWLADEYYSDIVFLQDMSGDRIHDNATEICTVPEQRTAIQIMIAVAVKESCHEALSKAMDNLIKDWKER